jgi:twitching motility protein PilJ
MATQDSQKRSSRLPAFNPIGWLQGMPLRLKVPLAAIVLGVMPLAVLGTVADNLAANALIKETTKYEEALTQEMVDKLNRYMKERYGDIQVLARSAAFANPKISAQITQAEKNAILDAYVKDYGVFDSIAFLDTNGDVIAQSKGDPLSNHKDRSYFQEALKSGQAIISEPSISSSSGVFSVYTAAPVRDTATDKIIGVVRGRIPVDKIEEVIANFGSEGEEYHIADPSGSFFLASEKEQVGRNLAEDLPAIADMFNTKQAGSEIGIDKIDNAKQLIAYAPFGSFEGIPDLGWHAVIAIDKDIILAPERALRFTLLLGTVATGLAVAALAFVVARRATQPLLDTAEAVTALGSGDMETRVTVRGNDELAQLGFSVNRMAEEIQGLLSRQVAETKRAQLFGAIGNITRRADLATPLSQMLGELRAYLKVDRVVVYRFNVDYSGYIAGESVLSGWPQALSNEIGDPCIPKALLDAYRKGRMVPTHNVLEANFHADHVKLMHQLKIKSNLVVPVRQGEDLYGLLVAHHCANQHEWQQFEIDYLTDYGLKLGQAMSGLSSLERKEFEAERDRRQAEQLQAQLVGLLSDVEGAASGDLTVRANVSVGELGTVADFFNAIIESLRDIVVQVQQAAGQVNLSVGTNESAIRQLADEALAQADEITTTLNAVEDMTRSIREVSDSARQAAEVARTASTTAEAGGAAMDRTVASIVNLRETVAETAKKVKRLGESSQQISKVVSLINEIALKTNLLAVNASIEAARAGEEGQGFAVVAEEVGALADQSAAATKDIEQIVAAIQRETNEVVGAMELGTAQVVEGTRLVEDTKQSLGQILEVARQIDQLLQSISNATVSQTRTSATVSDLMKAIAKTSENTSVSSRQVSSALRDTVAVARQLESTVGAFKVGNEASVS